MSFEQAERRFADLEQRYRAGRISQAQYRTELARLRVVDADGYTWQMQESTGRWYVHRQGQWAPATPPSRAAAPPTAPAHPQPPPKKRKAGGRRWLIAAGGLLALLALCVGLIFLAYQLLPDSINLPDIPGPLLGQGEVTPSVESMTISDLELEEALTAEVVDDRPEVLAYLGRPDAFTISILTVEGFEVRMESWRYYQFGTRVDFVDGEAVWTIEIEPVPDGTIFAAWYDPLAFEVGMTAAEVSQVAAAASPAGAEPETIDLAPGGEDLAGGVALVGDQILIGVYQDRVVYVETIALFPEEGEP